MDKEKKEALIEVFNWIIAFLFFPLCGLVLIVWALVISIDDLYKINKHIKEEKIKEIIKKDLVIIKDENGNIKEIKL